MNYHIHITKRAKREILHAADYIEFTLFNPTAADALVDKAEEYINSLSQLPQRNRLVDDPILSSWGVRSIMIDSYLAFYVVSEEDKTVYVVRFLYGRRDWVAVLSQGFSLE